MKEIGILFQDDMARAIVDGRKTLTSRLRGLDEVNSHECWLVGGTEPGYFCFQTLIGIQVQSIIVKCPYGQAGDVLIGRECWATTRGLDHVKPRNLMPGFPGEFRAGGTTFSHVDHLQDRGRWRPGIFLPFHASRLRLTVVRVWPSRLQDMTEEMAIQEGVEPLKPGFWKAYNCTKGFCVTALMAYETLWHQINGEPRGDKPGYPWESNCWVWRVEFKRIKP